MVTAIEVGENRANFFVECFDRFFRKLEGIDSLKIHFADFWRKYGIVKRDFPYGGT